MSFPQPDSIQLSPDEINRIRHYLDMGSEEVASFSDNDVETCLKLLASSSPISSERRGESTQSDYEQNRFGSPRFVGKGSFGVVFVVFDNTLGMDVAIKLLRPSRNSQIVQKRFLEEARITANLNHPGIIRMYDSGMIGDIPYITSAIADRGSLADRIALNPHGMPPTLASTLLCQVAEAVAYAHSKLTYHRDIKPSNILMMSASDHQSLIGATVDGCDDEVAFDTANGIDSVRTRPVLTDFGLAKRWDKDSNSLTLEGDILGTARYMSPEQAKGDLGEYSVKSEVFTLGIILFEMLTGTVPFRGQSSTEVRKSIVQDRPLGLRTLKRDIPKDLVAIIGMCLEKSPEHRYESVAMFAKDLRRFLSGKPVEASKPTIVRMALWQIRQHPWIASFFLLTCFTISFSVVGVSYAWWRQYLSSVRELQTKVDYVISLGKLADDVFAGEKDQQDIMLETLKAFQEKLEGDLASDLGNSKLRHLLSVVQHYKSTVLARSGKTEESMFCRIDSIVNLKILRDQNPSDAKYRFQYLYGIATISEAMQQTGLDRVRSRLASVIGVSDSKSYAHYLINEINHLMKDFDTPVYLEACNSFRVQAANILMVDERKEALEQFKMAIRLSIELAEKYPESPKYIKGALDGLWVLAGDASQFHNGDEMESYAVQAIQVFEKYLRSYFNEDWVRSEFAMRHTWYATALCKLGRYEKAYLVADETEPINKAFLAIDATRVGAELREFKIYSVQFKSLLELGRREESAAIYPKLVSAAKRIREPEFVRLDGLNTASMLQLPDEIQSILRSATHSGDDNSSARN